MRDILRVLLCGLTLSCGMNWSQVGRAELVRLEIRERTLHADGKPLDRVGVVERLRGTAHFALDPTTNVNRGIVDLELAPRNEQGRVEFSTDVELWLPKDLTKLNGTLFYEVNNRGKKTSVNMFDTGAEDFLLRQGFACVWSGWIAEVTTDGTLLRMNAPVPTENGKPLRGLVRSELVVPEAVPQASLSHRGMQGSYRPSARGLESAQVTRRVREADPRETIPREQWELIVTDVSGGQLPVIELKVQGGLQPGVIYEVIYEAEGSLVQGVGLAGIRDLISFLKHDASEKNPLVAGGKNQISRAVGFGTSQSGRLLRHYLYEGFNADEQGRIVFDGVMSHVAGGGLGFFNHRFASPTRTNGQHEEHLYPADYFPFAYDEQRDPHTGKSDGILKKARAAGVAPKLMHTQSSSEYWHRAGSLAHTDPLGRRDAEVPPEVRFYTFAGTAHGPGPGLPAERAAGQLPGNPNDYRPLLRGLVIAMHDWLARGIEPPPSVYPRLSDRTLVPWQEAESGWKAIGGVQYPTVIHTPALFDRGPDWDTFRRAAIEPPKVLQHYVVRVPAYGPDNNEQGCLMTPAAATPTATYTSWNLRHASVGAEGELLGLQGGYIPFAPRASLRQNDPRPSLAERYETFERYQRQFMAAAAKLVADRYMLAEDLPRQQEFCEQMRKWFDR